MVDRSAPDHPPPDLLVLGGGGILGEAWMSAVLAGIESAGGFDARRSGSFLGTSAGSIVAAALAGGVSPTTRVGTLPQQPEVPETATDDPSPLSRILAATGALAGGAVAPAAALTLRSTAGAGALARRAALARVPVGGRSLGGLERSIDELGLRWDGRLLVAAVDLASGKRVVFGVPGAPDVTVAEAVLASCAIPGVFEPLRAGGRSYVDGGAWSPTNMDGADVDRGDRVLCLNPTGSLRPTVAAPAGVLGPVSRSIATAEALVLRRRGARVHTVNPDRDSAAAMGSSLMSARGRPGVIAAGLAQGTRLYSSASR